MMHASHVRRWLGCVAAVAGLGAWLGAINDGAAVAQIQTPSISCSVADSNLTLEFYMPLASDGSGAALGKSTTGSLEIHHFKVPKERRRWSLDGRPPTQFWYVGGDMRLRFVLATGDDLVDLVIETATRQGDGVYAGNFRLQTGEGVRVTGRLQCFGG